MPPTQDVVPRSIADDFSTEEDDEPDDNRHLLSKKRSGTRKPPGPKKLVLPSWQRSPIQSQPWRDSKTSNGRQDEGTVSFSVRHIFARSWLNVLLIFVPFGIAAHTAGLNNPTIIFALNAIAIVPLTGLLTYATECVAQDLGVGVGSLLNITFGNLVELVILIFMLREGHLRIVLASLLGSIFVNLLFILGLSIMSAGIRKREQIYNQRTTQILVFFMTTGVLSLLIPTSLHACVRKLALADSVTLKFSRGLSVTLLLVYGMFLHFQISSQSNGGPIADLELSPVDSEDTLAESPRTQKLSGTRKRQSKRKPDEEPRISKIVALILLLSSAGVVSMCAEFMVDSIEHVVANAPITEAFLGLIILPLLGNVAELGTAVTVAVRQKIDLAINVTVGSAVQISLFMAPVVTLLAWATGKDLSLYFDLFQVVGLLATMLIVNIMLLSGRCNYLLGVLLFACYVVIGTGAFFLPNQKGWKTV